MVLGVRTICAVGSDVVWLAERSAQSHNIIYDVMGLSCEAPGHCSQPRVHTVRCVCTTSDVVKSLTMSLVVHIVLCVPSLSDATLVLRTIERHQGKKRRGALPLQHKRGLQHMKDPRSAA